MIKLQIGDAMVSRVLVDSESSLDILFWGAFLRMGIENEAIKPVKTSLHAFNGVEVKPLRLIALPMYAADRVEKVKFLVVDTFLAINMIMGREWIHTVKGIVSKMHQVMRCQSLDVLYTVDIKGDQLQNKRCYNIESQGGGV